MNPSLSRLKIAVWIAANLRPHIDDRVEWVWLWVRMPTVLVGAIGAGFRFQGASELPLVYLMAATVWAYSLGLAFLLRRGYRAFAFTFGIIADSMGLVATWWIILQIPQVEETPTDLYLILFPVLIAGVIRLGPWLGAVYSFGWIGWMAFVAWGYHGPNSYAIEEFPVRALFLILSVGLTAMLVAKIRSGKDQLEESERKFRNIFESAPVGIALVGLDRRAFEVNEGLASMLKLSREDLIGRRLSDFEGEKPARVAGANFASMTVGETDRVEIERRLRRGDGSFIWVNATTSAVRDSEGDVVYAVRIIEDITERKAVDFAKDELMALTSHELKTPLTAIHAALGLAANGALGELPGKASAMLDIASKNSDRLVSLVQNILDLESMRLGRVPLDMAPCDSFDLLHQTAELLGPAAAENGVTITVDAEQLDIVCAEDKIQQVLTNLAGNAMKFSPGGQVGIACHWASGSAVFEVRDDGPGIPADQQGLIFERFRQADTTATRTAGGTGLGLAIAKAIVEGHRGRIWVESKPGQGSVFKFTVPTTRPPVRAQSLSGS